MGRKRGTKGNAMQFVFTVTEIRAYRVEYTVEAADMDSALNMAASGDTVSEETLKCEGVLNREIWGYD